MNLMWTPCEATDRDWALGCKGQTYWVDDDGQASFVESGEFDVIPLADMPSMERAKRVCEIHDQLLEKDRKILSQ